MLGLAGVIVHVKHRIHGVTNGALREYRALALGGLDDDQKILARLELNSPGLPRRVI